MKSTRFSEIHEGQKDNFHIFPLVHKAYNNVDFPKVKERKSRYYRLRVPLEKG